MFAVCEGAVVFVNIRDHVIDESISKAGTGCRIPITIIGKDHDERRGLLGMDKSVCDGGRAESHPLILIVGLSVK